MDVLSDVLRTLRLTGEFFFRTDCAGRWAVRIPADRRRIRVHLVTEGTCTVLVPGLGRAVTAGPGNAVLIPHGAEQVLAADADPAAEDLRTLLSAGRLGPDGVLRLGEGARTARMVCGLCRFDESDCHPLFAQLPPVLVLRAGPWLGPALHALVEGEGPQAGLGALADRLFEILFIQAVRGWAAEGPGQDSFLAALADRQLSRALEALHAAPDRDWTIGDLARAAALSRSVFAERFRAKTGMAPMQYLTEWRLSQARRLLLGSRLSVAEVAHRAGYASLPSFTRRFKARFGIGPGEYRRSPEAAAPAAAA
ncbi:MAG TPA: AraC family transcriptional regulator [Azospirillaceae bacterium]|nr:AraC family transcriptional regulator [Azospirillaceae bacterium]